jgi:hypothetical protein
MLYIDFYDKNRNYRQNVENSTPVPFRLQVAPTQYTSICQHRNIFHIKIVFLAIYLSLDLFTKENDWKGNYAKIYSDV